MEGFSSGVVWSLRVPPFRLFIAVLCDDFVMGLFHSHDRNTLLSCPYYVHTSSRLLLLFCTFYSSNQFGFCLRARDRAVVGTGWTHYRWLCWVMVCVFFAVRLCTCRDGMENLTNTYFSLNFFSYEKKDLLAHLILCLFIRVSLGKNCRI